MRNKRSGTGQPPHHYQASQYNEDESSSDAQNPASNSSSASALASFSNKRAADMLAAYKTNSGSELGSGDLLYSRRAAQESTNSGSDHLAPPKTSQSGAALLSEIREGAERLASELDEFLSKRSDKLHIPRTETPLSDEAIADLQLASARKLREVRQKSISSFL